MKAHTHLLGIDVGGTKILAVLLDGQGRKLAEYQEATTRDGQAALIAQIVGLQVKLCQMAGVCKIELDGIGVGMPAAVHPSEQSLQMIPNIPGVAGTDFVRELRQALDAPIVLENDVNAAALGEAWLGHRGDPLAFVALGTGIGMGLVMGGNLCRGHRGVAGEIALLPLGVAHPDAEACRQGILEAQLSGKAWLRAYRNLGGDPQRDLPDLFAAPDVHFSTVLNDAANLLALAIMSVSAIVDPEIVCLGGSIGLQPALLAYTRKALSHFSVYTPHLCHSYLGGYAGAIGAARAAMLASVHYRSEEIWQP